MQNMVEKVFAQYGTDMTLVSNGESKTVRGFFQAMRSTSWQSIENEATVIGEINRREYSYMGPAEAALKEGDSIMLDKRKYIVRRVEPYYYGNTLVYQWALCVEKDVNNLWGARS